MSFEIYKLQFRFGLFPTHFGVLVKKIQAGKGLVDETNWNQYLGASTFNDKADCDMSPKKENHKKWSLLSVLHQFAHNKSGKFSLCYWLASAKKHQPFGTCWPVKLHPGEIEAMGQKLDDLDSSRLYVGEFGFRGFHQWDSGQSQCEHGLVPWIPILEGKTGWMWTSIRSIMRTSIFLGNPTFFDFTVLEKLQDCRRFWLIHVIFTDDCSLNEGFFCCSSTLHFIVESHKYPGKQNKSKQTFQLFSETFYIPKVDNAGSYPDHGLYWSADHSAWYHLLDQDYSTREQDLLDAAWKEHVHEETLGQGLGIAMRIVRSHVRNKEKSKHNKTWWLSLRTLIRTPFGL